MIGPSLAQRTLLPNLLTVEPQPHREGNAKNYTKSGEQRVTAAISESGVHLLAEEWENETEHRTEDLKIVILR